MIRVLHVEDDPADVVRLADYWNDDELVVATTSADALTHLAAGCFDAVLLDLHLTNGRGFELYKRLALAAAPSVAIVVLTNYGDEALLARITNPAAADGVDGAEECLTKADVSPRAVPRLVRYAVLRKATERKRALVAHELTEALTECRRRLGAPS